MAHLSADSLSSTDSLNADSFCFSGRFLAFVPGEKSPYQRLLLAVVRSPGLPATCESCEILLGKALRRMMYRYLEPQDWVRVVGSRKLNKRSGQLEWKAHEIVKLSAPPVADQLQALARKTPIDDPSSNRSTKPQRVLICQKSDCRQRGSFAVSEAIAAALLESGGSADCSVKATGCMKRCKEGPNLVMPGGDRYSRVTPQQARSLVQHILPPSDL
jgi:(2Fe-2S) ferredoxin